MSASVLDRVRAVTSRELDVPGSEIKEESSFQDDLGADSLDVVELVMALEEEFGIDIPDDDVTSIKTVGDAVTYVDSKLG